MNREQALTLWNETVAELGLSEWNHETISAPSAEGLKEAIVRFAEKLSGSFSEDDICRDDLPTDVFGLIHDLCYDHEGRDRSDYVRRAQDILRTPSPIGGSTAEAQGHIRVNPEPRKE